MNILSLPELFYLTSINLNDKEKIFLASSSKITYNFKSLIKLDLWYNLEINDNWCVKNIFIKEFTSESKIKELIKNPILESIVINFKYIKFTSNNTNIKLFHNEEIIERLVSYECYYLAMKIMLNNDESIDNINEQLIRASGYGYLPIVKLLIDLGADIHAEDDEAIFVASENGNLSTAKLLINLGANIRAQNNVIILNVSRGNNLDMAKLLIENGADIHVKNDKALINASRSGNLDMMELIIKNGVDVNT